MAKKGKKEVIREIEINAVFTKDTAKYHTYRGDDHPDDTIVNFAPRNEEAYIGVKKNGEVPNKIIVTINLSS